MGLQSMGDFKWPGLMQPDGARIALNRADFIAIDRYKDISYDPVYRPQAL